MLWKKREEDGVGAAATDVKGAIERLTRAMFACVFVAVSALGYAAYTAVTTQGEMNRYTAGATTVVVAKRTIAQGAVITSDDVCAESVPSAFIASGTLTNPQEAIGKIAAAKIAANAQIGAGQLAGLANDSSLSARVEPGQVAVSIPVDETTGVAGNVRYGDTVRVTKTQKGTQDPATIAAHAYVVALGENLVATDGDKGYRSVTVAVSEEEAYAIIGALAADYYVDLALNPPGGAR